MPTPTLHHLVLDLEATGLDKRNDEIVEVGAIGVTQDLSTVLFEYTTVVRATPHGLDRIRNNEYVHAMHTANGLLAELEAGAGVGLTDALDGLLTICDEHSDGRVVLGGSGVSHYDIPLLDQAAPWFLDRFDYTNRDIGPSRRLYKEITGTLLTDVDHDKTHRALDDCRCHLAEMRAFADLYRAHASPRNA